MTQPTLSPTDAARLVRQLRALADWDRIGPETGMVLKDAADALDAAHAKIAELTTFRDLWRRGALAADKKEQELRAELARLRDPTSGAMERAWKMVEEYAIAENEVHALVEKIAAANRHARISETLTRYDVVLCALLLPAPREPTIQPQGD